MNFNVYYVQLKLANELLIYTFVTERKRIDLDDYKDVHENECTNVFTVENKKNKIYKKNIINK